MHGRETGLRVSSPTSLIAACVFVLQTHQPLTSQNMGGSLGSYGAFHGAEVPFVFGYPAELVSAEVCV